MPLLLALVLSIVGVLPLGPVKSFADDFELDVELIPSEVSLLELESVLVPSGTSADAVRIV